MNKFLEDDNTSSVEGVEDGPMDRYLTAEANLMNKILSVTNEVNSILKGIASRNGGDEQQTNLKNYFSKEDYKNILGMDDDLVKEWIWYAKNIIQEPDLVDPMRNVSVLKRDDELGVARSVRGGIDQTKQAVSGAAKGALKTGKDIFK
jgi:hypothetical protein